MIIKLAITAFLLGILGLLHQKFFTGGGWFDWGQVLELKLHHEQLILACFIVGVALLVIGLRRKGYEEHYTS